MSEERDNGGVEHRATPAATAEKGGGSDEDLEEKDPFRELVVAQDTYSLTNAPRLLLGFRWDTTTASAVCDLDAVVVFFDDNAKALALVDCVQDTYSNVASLIDDSVYNLEGGHEEDLEKMMLDLTRVDPRVTTIVAGVRSLSMTFKAHAVSKIKCVCASLRFRRFSTDGVDDLAPAWQQRVVSSTRLFGVQHETRNDQQNNVVVLFILSRASASSPWVANAIYDELRCRDTTALKHLMSGYVASRAISEVAIKLPSIPALCAALTSKALPQMKDKFLAVGNSRGLKREPFVHAVFMHLYQTTKGLHVKADAARVVAMLDELFDQIDINGNDYVDWEEFTSFCIELGIISGKGANNGDFQPDDFIIDYQPVSVVGAFLSRGNGRSIRGGGADGGTFAGGTVKTQEFGHGPGVAFMKYVPELKQVYYADKGSHILKALDATGKPHHQYEFLDPYFVEGQHVNVHAVAHIPGRSLAVFCSDHSVNLMKEVKNRGGCTHGYLCEAKVMHQLMHRKLTWEPCFKKLISVGSDNHLYQWEVEDLAAGARRIYLRPEHVNTITDIVCIAEKELVVTSALDRRVCVWQVPSWKLRATFRDHSLGVQVLSYLRGTLLSAGFDWEIIAWDAERLEKIGKMTGHKSPVTAVAQMACPTNYEDMKAISADCNYELRLWDLSGCISGGNTIPCLMVFRLPDLASSAQGPKHIFLPFDPELSVNGYSNMLIASQSVASYAARKIKKEFFVPPASVYNSSSAHFLSVLRQNVHIWDATSGEYVRKLINVSPRSDIVSACFALPFERRLILGTEDGKLLLVNYVTGAILDEMQPHAAEVTSMAYCKMTKTIISTDYQGNVVVTSEMQCKLKELRKLNGVHGPGVPITAMAYSHRLSKIVTCSSSAELQVVEFQHFDLVAAAVQSPGEPSTGLAFLDLYSIIVLGDLMRACLWHLDMETFKLTCFAKLSVPARPVAQTMDVLNSVGVLRLENVATASAASQGQHPDGENAVAVRSSGGGGNAKNATAVADNDNDDDDEEKPSRERPRVSRNVAATVAGGSAKKDAYDEGEVWIALGTEQGRMACWTLEDVLESDSTLMPDIKLRPVPECLCPALWSSFNPYSQKVEPRRSALVPVAGVGATAASSKERLAASTGAGAGDASAGGILGGASARLTAAAATEERHRPGAKKDGPVATPTSPASGVGSGDGSSGGGGLHASGGSAAARNTASSGGGYSGWSAGIGVGQEAGGNGRGPRGDKFASAFFLERDNAASGNNAAGSAPTATGLPSASPGGDGTTSIDIGGGADGTGADGVRAQGERRSPGGDIDFDIDDEEEHWSWLVPEAAAPKAVWQAHLGPVAKIGSCSQPPCFYSLGEDGYQRAWSTGGEALGQFALPNVSDVQLKHRLFSTVNWRFLVDTVRVRPRHEEMTADLLEEVEKKRANKIPRGASTRGPSGFAKGVLTAAAASAATTTHISAAASTAAAAPTSSLGGSSAEENVEPAVYPKVHVFGVRSAATAEASALGGGWAPPIVAAAATIGPLSSARAASCGNRNGVGLDGAAGALRDDSDKSDCPEGDLPSDKGSATRTDREQAEASAAATDAAAAAKRRAEAECRRSALATMEKRSHHRPAPAPSPLVAITAPHPATAATAGRSGTPLLSVKQEGTQELDLTKNFVPTELPAPAVSRGDCSAVTAGNLSMKMPEAFSTQSVRYGATLGYYDREEVGVLSMISKNPSRIAAYSRITDSKRGSNEDDPSPELFVDPASLPRRRRPRTTASTLRVSVSAPLIQSERGGNSKPPKGEILRGDAPNIVSALTASTASSPSRTASNASKRGRPATSLSPRSKHASRSVKMGAMVSSPESEGVAVLGWTGTHDTAGSDESYPGAIRDRGRGVEVVAETRARRVRSAIVSEEDRRPTSRTVKMYRNAAREYAKGCSAGQAMWRELQRDPSTTQMNPRSKRRAGNGRGVSGRGRVTPTAADWSSGSVSTLLELPQIEVTPFSDKASWATRDGAEESCDLSDEEESRLDLDLAGGGGGGGGGGGTAVAGGGGRGDNTGTTRRGDVRASSENTSAAHDWFAATRHGRDDAIAVGGAGFSPNGGAPGWEDTYAFKRSKARRAIKTSRILAGKGPRRALSAAPDQQRWNWDWCSGPASALPAHRLENLFSRFDEALSSSPNISPTAASSAAPEGRHRSNLVPAGSTALALTAAGAVPTGRNERGDEVSDSMEAAAAVATATASRAAGSAAEDGGVTTASSRWQRRRRGIGSSRDRASSERGQPDKSPGAGLVRETPAMEQADLIPNVSENEGGKGHLISMEMQRRNRELTKVQQKIIALLVKGNDIARRREARDRQRGTKVTKKPLAKGPRPGQLGPHYTLQSVMDFRAAFNFVDEDMSGCLDSEEWRRFLDRFNSSVAAINMRSMFLHLDKDMSGTVEVGELVPVVFNKASTPQHGLIRHLIEYENTMDVRRFNNKHLPAAQATLQLDDAKRLFELYDTSGSGRLDQKTVRSMLLALRVPQLSWDALVKSAPLLQTAATITSDEFAAGFFEAFVM